MTKIVLSGYFGFGNLGDEAILASMVQGIRKQVHDADITVLSNSPQQTAGELQVRAVNRWSISQVVPAIKNCDIFVSGGGSLLQDVTGSKNLLYYLGLIWLAQRFRRKVMVFAQGIGPLTRKVSRFHVAKVLNKTEVISVRDRESYKLLRSIGVTRDIFVTADPVLALDVSGIYTGQAARLIESFGLQGDRVIVVCPRPWGDNAFVESLITALLYLKREKYRLCLLPFHHPGDLELCRELAASLGEGAVVLDRRLSFGEIFGLFAQAQLVIGMRLHSLIFAAAAGTPMVGISYDPKVDSFLNQVEQPCAGHVGRLTAGAVVAPVGEVLNAPYSYRERLEKNLTGLKKRALENYHLLSRLV
ncbi:MAG: polysaccharide pyruvyl transferase CsaB [Thermoanaerobacteraceae bacterium]|nr:polysaccharide pyruvyl transferase CsaB [Thermoanaerobacteraceae bacterium]